jgi:hypothetical protein
MEGRAPIVKTQRSEPFMRLLADIARAEAERTATNRTDSQLICNSMDFVAIPGLPESYLVRARIGGGAEADIFRFGVQGDRVVAVSRLLQGRLEAPLNLDDWNSFVRGANASRPRSISAIARYACFVASNVDNYDAATSCEPPDAEVTDIDREVIEVQLRRIRRRVLIGSDWTIARVEVI